MYWKCSVNIQKKLANATKLWPSMTCWFRWLRLASRRGHQPWGLWGANLSVFFDKERRSPLFFRSWTNSSWLIFLIIFPDDYWFGPNIDEGRFFFWGGGNLASVSKGRFFGGAAALPGAWPTQEGRRFRDSTIAGSLGASESWGECEWWQSSFAPKKWDEFV